MDDEPGRDKLHRDEDENDPDGRMTDLLPDPEEDFTDEAIVTETEDDYSDESDAEVDSDLFEVTVSDGEGGAVPL